MAQTRQCLLALVLFLSLTFEGSECLFWKRSKPRACVIGAGIAGLASARYLKENGVDFTVFEGSAYIGGTWHFDPRSGYDEHGYPIYTSMYKYLKLNTPRQTMEFSGFPMPENTPSYPTGECFSKYVTKFAKHFDIIKHIQFQSLVTSLMKIGDGWELTYIQKESGTNNTEPCDFIIIGNGHYSEPQWPRFEGEDIFKGKISHSHDYREPEVYANRSVLLVGAGNSGLDLAVQLSGITSKLVHSHHVKYNQPDYPGNYIKKPDIKKLTANGVIFQDDSYEDVDDIIYCTGYVFSHPFIDERCGVTCNEKFVLPLYQQMVNIRYPNMLFLGITGRTITRLIDVQAEYAAALAAGKFELPTREKMLQIWLDHVYRLQKKGKKIANVNYVGEQQDEYFESLAKEAGIKRAPPVLTDIMFFNIKARLDDLLHYRDYDIQIINTTHFMRIHNPYIQDQCTIEE